VLLLRALDDAGRLDIAELGDRGSRRAASRWRAHVGE
jgi:hypothetical protein